MSKNSKKSEKKHVVQPYILRPLLYFAISLVFVLPAALGLLKFGVNMVHRVQPHFSKTVSDIVPGDAAFTPSEQESGSVVLPMLNALDKVGELQCAEAGLACDVFYGANRMSYRNGAGLESDMALPGEDGTVRIRGYASTALKALENVKQGDEIVFTTSWGVYRYRVDTADVMTAEEAGEPDLLISTAKSKDAFATYAEKRLFVAASLVSGPTAEEVQS